MKRVQSRMLGVLILPLLLACASPPPADSPKLDAIKIEPLKAPLSESTPPPASVKSPQPKYGREIVLLRSAHDYIRENRALDYWALSPYYIGTPGECSCSTSLVMIVNAARNTRNLHSEEKLATTSETLERVMLPGIDWKERIASHQGLSLDEIPVALGRTLSFYGVRQYQLDVVHTSEMSSEIKKRVHDDLVENEKSDRNFILANFNQGVFTGDSDVGHIAVVGGYDSKRKQVLILDTDREWYEPYWISEETFIKGISQTNPKTAPEGRGYVKVKILETTK